MTLYILLTFPAQFSGSPDLGYHLQGARVDAGRILQRKVAWLRVDTQTILTIASHVITKNHRIGVTHSDHRTWYLHIRDMKESDRGWYMCQINTDPMKSQVGYLEVVDIKESFYASKVMEMQLQIGRIGLYCGMKYCIIIIVIIIIIIVTDLINALPGNGSANTRNNGNCVSVEEYFSSLLGSSQDANELPRSIQFTPSHSIYLRYILILSIHPRHGLPSGLFSSGFPTNILYAFRFSPILPPDILDYPTSTDMVVREGTNVTLRCAATGSPQPSIIWRREGGEAIPLGNGQEVASVEGPVFNITRVNRLHMGAYLCIASNGVPPTVSKRIMLIVHFPPMIWIQNQLVGAYEGQQITLDCNSEAYPKSINYWTGEKGEIIAQGGRYEPVLLDNAYKVHMKLTIRSVGPTDFGTYKCVSKNSLGDTDGSIRLYPIPSPLTPPRTTIITITTTTKDIINPLPEGEIRLQAPI
ncbi:hypothetical protein B7P43_G02446 [Cryptotermes secundus]|uniref:Ig-like domain-containing protein n=1 Tax=Cryptotermes secundus TaxID=105785 RepID=A0A2J7QVB7_9NEOP|nr:hypothetical protein B7P43_G02446 [Cryptotermes secundus]